MSRMDNRKLARPYELSGDTIVSAVDAFSGIAVDNFWDKHLVTDMMLAKKKIRDVGGAEVTTAVELGAANEGGTFRGNSFLRNVPKDSLDMASMRWANYYAPISINFDEKTENTGKEKQLDLIEYRVNSAFKTINRNFGYGLFDAGTKDYGDGVKNGLVGFPKMIDDGSTYAEYMGITYSATASTTGPDYSKWAAHMTSSAGYITLQDLEYISTVTGDGSTYKDDMVDLMITTKDIYHDLRNQVAAKLHGTPEMLTQWSKHRHFVWDNLVITFDGNQTSGQADFVNTNMLELEVHKQGNFARPGWLRANGQMSEVDYVILKTRMYSAKRNAHATVTGITNGVNITMT